MMCYILLYSLCISIWYDVRVYPQSSFGILLRRVSLPQPHLHILSAVSRICLLNQTNQYYFRQIYHTFNVILTPRVCSSVCAQRWCTQYVHTTSVRIVYKSVLDKVRIYVNIVLLKCMCCMYCMVTIQNKIKLCFVNFPKVYFHNMLVCANYVNCLSYIFGVFIQTLLELDNNMAMVDWNLNILFNQNKKYSKILTYCMAPQSFEGLRLLQHRPLIEAGSRDA